MRKQTLVVALTIVFGLMTFAVQAHNEGKQVTYQAGNTNCKGYVAYNAHIPKMPVVLVIPEWWGCNEYAKMRADMLASMGYFAFAVDMYGDGYIAPTPKEAGEQATKFYTDNALAMERINAAIQKLKDFPMADVENMAIIGYCFGGSMALNAARANLPVKAVVSFHGGLKGIANPAEIKPKILICHGGSDNFVSAEEVTAFKAEMDKVKASYRFIDYPGATHAFTNPEATAVGKKFDMPISYNAEADKKSWLDMKAFLAEHLKK